MDEKIIMRIEHHLTTKINTLSLSIKRACYTLGFVGYITSPTTDAANAIERFGSQAFSIPDDVAEMIELGPVVTTLQFITRTPQYNFYQNIIAGPIDLLFDRTKPGSDVGFSSNILYLDLPIYKSTLADLNNDGINTLISGTSEYDISSWQQLITPDFFNGTVTSNEILSSPDFIDIDGDGDLDMLISDWKYPNTEFYENIGSAEAHAFIHRETDISEILTQYSQTLPVGFLDHFNSLFQYSFPSNYNYPLVFDFDSDGDPDLLMTGEYPVTLKYFENHEKNGASLFSEPFSSIPAGDYFASWITDYDSDGDFDLLGSRNNGVLRFHERTNVTPTQYAPPVTISNFPKWINGERYFGGPSDISISRSRELFKDIDGDGFQEMLAIHSPDDQVYQLLLLTKLDDSTFDQQIIYQGHKIDYDASYSLQFIDGNSDGKYDIAFQFWYPGSSVK
ncbi:MAG: VCBS repeat-containing protein, partial [Candidatus Thiodiazotropha taylori]